MENERQRLTSWKEIGTHLGRDVRTVLRWEKERGLPVHRVPGVTGRVVFAYTDELDVWARGESEGAKAPLPATDPGPEPRRHWLLTGAIAALAMTGVVWTAGARLATGPLTVEVKPDGIVASAADGATRWRHPFAPGDRAGSLENRFPREAENLSGADPGVIAATSLWFTAAGSVRGGQLYWFSREGELRHTFGFDDRLTFGSGEYGAPWVLTDFRVDEGAHRQIALIAHHYEWWPSMVTVFDARWNRQGTFVNAGWIEHVFWTAGHKLVIAGFSNARDGGVIAMLDPDALDGQSPAEPGSPFRCTSCGAGVPLRYIVMPRTELNRATGSRFNRVILETRPDGFMARTVEIPVDDPHGIADVLYEFTPALQLVRATFSDRYWEIHRLLEADGHLNHTREQCPDRDGPREILVWEPSKGWMTQAIPHARVSDPPPAR